MYIITFLSYQIINLNLNLHILCFIGGEVVNGNFGASVAINFIGDSVKEYSTGAGSTNFLYMKTYKEYIVLLSKQYEYQNNNYIPKRFQFMLLLRNPTFLL